MNLEEIRRLHEEIIDILKRNRVFCEGTIGGYVVVGINGVELFSSTKKSCPDCLSRKNRIGETEHFHRSVVCMTVGKRLVERLKERRGHFADVVVVDALYMNAPFINTLKENGLEAVIRLKDETRLLFQDAEGLFNKDEGRKESFQKGKKTVKVWDFSGFEIEKSPHKLRVVRYQESWEEKGRNTERWMWLVTTIE